MAGGYGPNTAGPDRPTLVNSRLQTDKEQEIVAETIKEFQSLQTWRNTFGAHWEEIAELIWPEQRNTFYYADFNWPGQKRTDRQVDASGMLALNRFAAICDSLLTPRNQMWHQLVADDETLMRNRDVAVWFERATKALFKARYAPNANFSAQNQGHYKTLGAFGTSSVLVDGFDARLGGGPGLRYKQVPCGEMFFRENHQGLIDGFCRWFRMNAEQAYQKWPDTFPDKLRPALEQRSQMTYNFIHRVCPRTDYDADRLDYRGMPYASYYVCLDSLTLLGQGGYRSFPVAASRYDQAPGEIYGRSPAMSVLPALKTLNAQKRTFLKQGHRAADPVLLVADDGLVDISLRPGAINKGGVSMEGRDLVKVLPSGNIQVTKEMMDEERALINDAFLVSLFQILTETPTMTATEVVERVNEKGILLAPTLGRQQSEYLGPLIDRELDLLVQMRMLPPMPPALREAKGAYGVRYDNPLARAARAQEAAGFMRTLENVRELVAITQDMSMLDTFNFDTAVPAIADIQSVPASWMATPEQVQAKRKARAQAQARQEQIQAAPAQAAMMKAQAAVQQANPGQVQQQQQAPAQPGQPGQAQQ